MFLLLYIVEEFYDPYCYKQFGFVNICSINHCALKFVSNLQNKIVPDEVWSSMNDDLNNVKTILANPDTIKIYLSAELIK